MDRIEIIDVEILRFLYAERASHIDEINRHFKKKCPDGCNHRLLRISNDGLIEQCGDWPSGRFVPSGEWQITDKGKAFIQDYREKTNRLTKERWSDRIVGGLIGLIVGLLIAYFTHIIQ